MREFNTSRPCDPTLHYTVMREALILEGLEKVQKGQYFTLFAPKQAGKTTYFQLLLKVLQDENFIPIWITFEKLKTVTRDRFYLNLNNQLHQKLAKHQIDLDHTIQDQIDLIEWFEKVKNQDKSIVLVIDEFEGIPDSVLSEVMHTFREMYHSKDSHALHSLLLVGVSTIAKLVVIEASPFNIVEELQIPYFTLEEVTLLIEQYIIESGQSVKKTVIKAIYENTKGQPGLVCALCSYLVTKVATNRNRAVTQVDFYATLNFFMTKKFDKNIFNVIEKAREKRELMMKLLFRDEPIAFTVDNPDIAFLYANGVVDETNGYVDIPVPLYAKRLINAFRPLINGETQYYLNSPYETFNKYLTPTGGLNIDELLKEYRAYVRRRGFRAFDTDNLKEGAWHYSLDGFINFFIQGMEGQTLVEVPSGAGRTDILIIYQNNRYLIEIKVFTNNTLFKKGKAQLAEYLKSEGLDEGYYVVFSNLHTDEDELYEAEKIKGKQIYTYIICTHFPTPSNLPVPEEIKLTETEKVAIKMLGMGNFSDEQINQATGVSLEKIRYLREIKKL